MDQVQQLWLLQQIYSNENSYYDSEQKLHLHRIPSDFSAEDIEALAQAHRQPNKIIYPKHDDVLKEFHRLADAWTLSDAADAFLAGLWSAPFLWQSALTAKLISLGMPPHAHTPYGGSNACTICGFCDTPIDAAHAWYRRMTGGTPLDGEPVGHVAALQEMEQYDSHPVPTTYDLWTFRAILSVIRSMPAKSRYSKVRDALYKERLLPTSRKWVYGSLLETLALIGILDTDDYPGMATQFTTYQKRDMRPSIRVEVQAPLAWWDSSIGINEMTLKKIFPQIEPSPVSLTDRPAPIPPLSQTLTGQLERKRKKYQILPKSPDAGTGPVQAGDVYGIRVRDDLWITVYCHRVEGKYAVVEYLDGIFPKMPSKSQLKNTFRPRYKGSILGRWQTKTSGIDRTTGVKRIARNIPLPAADMPAPDSASFSGAKELSHLAHWCFPEI